MESDYELSLVLIRLFPHETLDWEIASGFDIESRDMQIPPIVPGASRQTWISRPPRKMQQHENDVKFGI